MGDLSYHKSIPAAVFAYQAVAVTAYCCLPKKVEGMDRKQLFIELMGIQGRGITIFIEGEKSTPETVANLLCVQEENSYMRDYVYDEGVLTELHFDKVQNQ